MPSFIQILQGAIVSRLTRSRNWDYSFIRDRTRLAVTISPETWCQQYIRENRFRAIDVLDERTPNSSRSLYGKVHSTLTLTNRQRLLVYIGKVCEHNRLNWGTFFAAANAFDSYLRYTSTPFPPGEEYSLAAAAVRLAVAAREPTDKLKYLVVETHHPLKVRVVTPALARNEIARYQLRMIETLQGDFNFNWTPADLLITWMAAMYCHPHFEGVMEWLEGTDLIVYFFDLTMSFCYATTANGVGLSVPPSHLCAACFILIILALHQILREVRAEAHSTGAAKSCYSFMELDAEAIQTDLATDIMCIPGGYEVLHPHMFWVSDHLVSLLRFVIKREDKRPFTTMKVAASLREWEHLCPRNRKTQQWMFYAAVAMKESCRIALCALDDTRLVLPQPELQEPIHRLHREEKCIAKILEDTKSLHRIPEYLPCPRMDVGSNCEVAV